MYKTKLSCWQGLPPPQYVYANLRFKGVALEPPNFEPGSWCGAGKCVLDIENEEFILTSRPRKVEGDVRGFAANIYKSKDGVKYDLVSSLLAEEVAEKSKIKIHSIEGTQLLKDPLTGQWYFYLSCDTGPEFIWGGIFWETMLFAADDLKGPWEYQDLVIRHGLGQAYDAVQSRDSSIDIVDGKWWMLYRAHDREWRIRMALATSADGINWTKHGPFLVDGAEVFKFGMSGTTFAGTFGPTFMGLCSRTGLDYRRRRETREVDFCAFNIDRKDMNLETIFRGPWIPKSPYELKQSPLHGSYSSMVYDPWKNRMLLYVEAIGLETKEVGLNTNIERQLVYESQL